jgi:hypothetical protein
MLKKTLEKAVLYRSSPKSGVSDDRVCPGETNPAARMAHADKAQKVEGSSPSPGLLQAPLSDVM